MNSSFSRSCHRPQFLLSFASFLLGTNVHLATTYTHILIVGGRGAFCPPGCFVKYAPCTLLGMLRYLNSQMHIHLRGLQCYSNYSRIPKFGRLESSNKWSFINKLHLLSSSSSSSSSSPSSSSSSSSPASSSFPVRF
mmetsp:Transcript_18265/g.25980  ORF Transcript_18265/g.25980 Transcript_18265/m.25980 type:complete len:137 (-) Transcript_18265:42-452(-)